MKQIACTKNNFDVLTNLPLQINDFNLIVFSRWYVFFFAIVTPEFRDIAYIDWRQNEQENIVADIQNEYFRKGNYPISNGFPVHLYRLSNLYNILIANIFFLSHRTAFTY